MRSLSFNQLFALLFIIFAGLLAASALSAWTGPTATAPNGNVSAPINVGTTDQVKNAGLSVNALGVFGSEYVQNNLGVGRASPVTALDVNGTIRIANGSETCQSVTAGSIRYNSSNSHLEFCDGSSWQQIATVFPTNAQIFTSSGTWTKPSGATNVKVECWGGGGGGSGTGDVGGYGQSGAGGGGGGYVTNTYAASALPASVAVTVGAGGTGAAPTSGGYSTGGTGGTSSFGSYLSAYGGTGAVTSWQNAGSDPSYGGTGGGGTGGSVTNGGNGGGAGSFAPSSHGSSAGASSSCGGGGGGAGYWSYGGSAATSGGTSGCGGNGGAGSPSGTGNGSAGTAPGGGGGGSGGTYLGGGGSGGAGGRGQCTVTST